MWLRAVIRSEHALRKNYFINLSSVCKLYTVIFEYIFKIPLGSCFSALKSVP